MRNSRLRGVLVAALTSAAVLIEPGIGSAAMAAPAARRSRLHHCRPPSLTSPGR